MTDQSKNETRKLAAIMFTDIVGYTAIMSRDEKKALAILQRKRDVIKPLIKKHNGEFLKEIGDGTLSSFHSAVEAVNCGKDIQSVLQNDPDLNLRVGIHIGDVVFSSGDVFGDGVNIASRIETLAEPGGVCISEQVYQAVRSMPEISTAFIGEKTLKNVDHPIKVYALTGEGLRTPTDVQMPAVSHYKLLEKIGEGGMGTVYKAEDTKLKREVAVKFLPRHISSDNVSRERFRIEARAAASLNHQNIATIYEIGETEGETYIAMEYVKGQSLKEKVNAGPMKLGKAIDTAVQIAEGLEEAHEKGVIHRDIKSSNIMITEKGRAKITDFGLAKMPSSTFETREGTVLGTAAYMSPQQARGEEVDHLTDIWSLGVVLFEMLTGDLPFKGEYEQAVLYSILNVDSEPLTQIRKDAPKKLEQIINKAMEKEPEKRFQSVSEFKNSLKELLQEDERIQTSAYSSMDAKVSAPRFNIRKLAVPATVITGIIIFVLLITFGFDLLSKRFGFEGFPSEKSLLVMPIINIGEDPKNQFFCDGLTEILSSRLTQLEQFHGSFWVVPMSDVKSENISSVSEARDVFGVNLVITGSMQRYDDFFSLALNLVDTKNLRQFRSEVITDHINNLSLLQSIAVTKLSDMLQLKIKPDVGVVLAAGITRSSDAYKLYSKGKGYLLDYHKIGNIETAIKLFKQALDEDPNYALAYAGLGEAYWRKYGETKETILVELAVNNCDRALEINKMLAHVHLTKGIIYTGTGRYEEAEKELNETLTQEPENFTAFRELGRTYALQGLYDLAEDAYKRAIKLKPRYWAGYNVLGSFYLRQGRLEEGAEQFLSVIEMNIKNPKIYRNLGTAYFLQKKYRDAIEIYNRSLEIEDHYNAYANIGTCYFYEGEFKQAARMYEKALEINDRYYIIWGNLASALYWSVDERDKAREKFERAVAIAEENRKVNPNDQEILSNLAEYYSMLGERDKASGLLQSLIQLQPEQVETMFNMANTYEILGDRDKALEWIGKALEGGYELDLLERAQGLQDLREDERFKQILKKIKD
ncbi:protein kinase [candidate division KSB1 bacterium]